METLSRFFPTANLRTSPLRLSPLSWRLTAATMIIDGKNASLPRSKRIPKTLLKTAIAPHVFTVICRYHVRVSKDDLTDEALLAFLQGYTKTSLNGDDYDLTFLGAEIEYQMNLKPYDIVENLTCQ